MVRNRRSDDGRGSGPASRIAFAWQHFSSMPGKTRRQRFASWATKPDLFGRTQRYLLPGSKGLSAPSFVAARSPFSRPIAPIYRDVANWIEARDQNASTVARILGAADIDFVEVDDELPGRRQFAVDAADRPAVVDAFLDHGRHGEFIVGAPWTKIVRLQIGSGTRVSRWATVRRLKASTHFVVCHLMRHGAAGRVLGLGYGTVISFWERDDEEAAVVASAPNRWCQRLPDPKPREPVLQVVSRGIGDHLHISDITFPIDLVCLWVDGDDPEWEARRRRRLAELSGDSEPGSESPAISSEATLKRLYRSRDELKYAIRSVEMFAPFINHIYLVTDQQVPGWLDEGVGGLTVIDHSDIFPAGTPPIFNSSAIDTRLHHIPGLSEHFLLSNDDVMFFNPVFPSDFFTPGGSPKLFLSRSQIPMGPAVPGEAAVDSAGRNTSDLFEQAFGVRPTQKFKHIPMPQRVSHRARTAERFAEQTTQTTSSSFRSSTDITFGQLSLFEALHLGEAIEANLAYDYIGLDSPGLEQRLTSLASNPGRIKAICLNDADLRPAGGAARNGSVSDTGAERERDRVVRAFLDRSFPIPSSFEKSSTNQPVADGTV